MTSWWCGRVLPRWQRVEHLPHKDKLQRWGSPLLLLAWLPLIGDALCVAAGWLRLHWLPCCAFIATGKLGRYWLVTQVAVGF
jgi:membrane protein YqaA with SNARE-associated domain